MFLSFIEEFYQWNDRHYDLNLTGLSWLWKEHILLRAFTKAYSLLSLFPGKRFKISSMSILQVLGFVFVTVFKDMKTITVSNSWFFVAVQEEER